MPPSRRKPTSTKQKKAEIQLRRAIKRGDAQDPTKTTQKSRRSQATDPSIHAARRLQSAFVRLSPEFLQQARLLASKLPLERPIPAETAIFSDDVSNDSEMTRLSCPRRPKWRYDMSKKEVERNEEGLFSKWLQETDETFLAWQQSRETAPDRTTPSERHAKMPSSPTYFERNLEVWRQLWRVTEISQILLVLLDSRCPLLHFPPSLRRYLSDRKIILVLTKVDISGPERVDAWFRYFSEHFPGLPIVRVESYVKKESAHKGKFRSEPHIPQGFKEHLVRAIRKVHAELLEPPEQVKNSPLRLQKWKPPVKQEIDWAYLVKLDPDAGHVVPSFMTKDQDEMDGDLQTKEPEFLTIGLIGQPNVGKSSLLNALFGANKVHASKTPGKTKHFQTLFWAPDVRLVDCPGLVMPNYVPMELQVLSGILPIARVSAIPSCIFLAAQLLPLEEIYKLTHPSITSPPQEDKRTWRGDTRLVPTTKAPMWTAMDILATYANLKGWVTAKAGRPDINRAGNAILRALAEGRIGWAFWPAETKTEATDVCHTLATTSRVDAEGESSDETEAEEDIEDGITDEDYVHVSEAGEEDEADEGSPAFITGRFGALAVDDD